MKHLLFFLLLIINSLCLWSQVKLKRDSSYIISRSFNNAELKEFKASREFQYDSSMKPEPTLWSRFWAWVWGKINRLLSTKGGRITFWSILSILGIIAMFFFILKLIGMDKEGLFEKGTRGLQKYTLSQNDIHNISFDEEIKKAIRSANYRLAIRLQYLRALKTLSDKRYIDWRINKTNTDYLTEVAGRPFYPVFNSITFDFEYIWYGGKQLSEELFLEINMQFQQFNNQV